MPDAAPVTVPEHGASKVLGALRLDSIKNRILALALLATLVPALGTVVLSYRQNRRALTENLNGELRSRGSQAAREVDLWVKQRSYDVRVFTGSFEVSENLERIPRQNAASAVALTRLTDYLTGVRSRFTDYERLVVLDADARPVASSGEPGSDVSVPSDWLPRLQAGETVLGDPSPEQSTARVSATLAAPIQTTDGRFVGVLAAKLTFGAVADILRAMAPGQGGRVDLVTEQGLLIASSDSGMDRSAPDVSAETLQRLDASAGATVEYVDRDGTEAVGTLTHVPGLAWAVVAQIPSAEAYAQVADLRNSAILLVSMLLVVVGGIAYLLGVVIVRPLARLTQAAGAVAGGDLSVDLPGAGRGEVGYLTDVFNDMVGRLRRSREELDERNRALEQMSVTDILTGLYNRRFLLDAFDKEIRRADRHERPFCVVMIDVDRFKQFNDTHGHLAGDGVLEAMGRVITDATRDLDVAARYGGEEFVVLLPECDLANGVLAAERIRTRLAQESFHHGDVTISVGVAEFPTHGESAGTVIGAADEALYEAKANGRDQVRGAPPKPRAESAAKAGKRTAHARKKRGTPKKKKA